MKIPKKINILGNTWKIKIQSNDPYADMFGKDRFWMGYCDSKNQLIYINNSDEMTDEVKFNAFFHELTHAICFEAGLNRVCDDDMNEVIAQTIGNGFHKIFKQLV
jgi:Zn-dependent peptidase ImmA (M78 family)